MSENPRHSEVRVSKNPVLRQLNKLHSSGRITSAEADAIESAKDDEAMHSARLSIRTRHAGAQLDAAVADGSVSRADADALLSRVKGGEHSRGLRSHINRLQPGSGTGTPAHPTDDLR
jgi:hypothetical protein